MELKEAIRHVTEGNDLDETASYGVASRIMGGEATDAQIAALLMGLRFKGETIDEITGFVRAMRDKATPVTSSMDNLVDTCGTGGDCKGTINISTLSGLVAAAAGCGVAKHGNRSVSSQCGSADLLKALGLNIDIPVDRVSRCIDTHGFGFLFAPHLHKAMKYAVGPRREIGVRTIFNILGPLTNPAGARRQVLGVFQESLTEPLATVLANLGSDHVMVVHGEDGMDEITLTGKTLVSELKNGEVSTYSIQPEDFGMKRHSLKEIQGGNAETNARIALAVLKGEEGAARDVVLINAGAVMMVAGRAGSIRDGMAMAADAIDSGSAMEKLQHLKDYTNQEA